MTIIELRRQINTDVFSYLELTDLLSSHYINVRDKITKLLASGDIIRIKKGLYAFSDVLRRRPLNLCAIANLIYGPSYVSCDYALSRYGIIPEKVVKITSVSLGRSRNFYTPLGGFLYFQHKTAAYSVGISWESDDSGNYLIATPEKALYDKALTDVNFDGGAIGEYLFEDLRIEPEFLTNLNKETLRKLRSMARGRMLKLLAFLEGINESGS